jgi:hypothetical protein
LNELQRLPGGHDHPGAVVLQLLYTGRRGEKTMTIRTQLKAGSWSNHNEALRVKTSLKVGSWTNHNEALQVRSALKAGGTSLNHNEALRRDSYRPAISMRRQPRTTGRKADRLELLVVRAGLRAGRRARV